MQAAVPGCFVKWWWGRGPQKSPPETFVRGLAVPPCSTPVTMQKKRPQKALRFLGFYISAGGGGRTHTVSPPTDFESAQVRRTWWIF